VGFSPDGKRLVCSDGDYQDINKPGEVQVWEWQTRTVVHRLKGHVGWVNSATFSPDGWDNTVRVWDVPNNR
jgi:WD40 repeat protein